MKMFRKLLRLLGLRTAQHVLGVFNAVVQELVELAAEQRDVAAKKEREIFALHVEIRNSIIEAEKASDVAKRLAELLK